LRSRTHVPLRVSASSAGLAAQTQLVTLLWILALVNCASSSVNFPFSFSRSSTGAVPGGISRVVFNAMCRSAAASRFCWSGAENFHRPPLTSRSMQSVTAGVAVPLAQFRRHAHTASQVKCDRPSVACTGWSQVSPLMHPRARGTQCAAELPCQTSSTGIRRVGLAIHDQVAQNPSYLPVDSRIPAIPLKTQGPRVQTGNFR